MWHTVTGKGHHITECTLYKGHLPIADTSTWSCSVRNSEVSLYLEDMVYVHTLQPEILVDSNFVVWYAGANADILREGLIITLFCNSLF